MRFDKSKVGDGIVSVTDEVKRAQFSHWSANSPFVLAPIDYSSRIFATYRCPGFPMWVVKRDQRWRHVATFPLNLNIFRGSVPDTQDPGSRIKGIAISS